jgi:DNA polymerase delta subunit 2
MAPQAPLPSLSEDKYVALVSGLGVGDDAADPLKLSLLVDYLVGSLASDEEQTRVSKVSYSFSSACFSGYGHPSSLLC